MPTYKSTGVDIAAAKRVKSSIGPLVEATHDAQMMRVSQYGQFASLVQFPETPGWVHGFTMDGVGTKLQLAIECGDLSTIGECLVSHCVNDLLTSRIPAKVLLDYIATGTLDPKIVERIVESLATACTRHRIALVGGETAQMPSIYAPGKYDFVATLHGMAPVEKVRHGLSIIPGMIVWGLPSSGPHNNGYTLIREVIHEINTQEACPEYGSRTWAEVLLEPTRCYSDMVFDALDAGCEIAGMANVTGGGIVENLVRILPEGCQAQIDCFEIEQDIPGIFPILQEMGGIPTDVMWESFNMGVGYMLVGPASMEGPLTRATAGEAFVIGRIVDGERSVRLQNTMMW